MNESVFGKVIDVIDDRLRNAPSSMVSNVLLKDRLAMFEQSAKDRMPRYVTEFGMVMDVSPVHPLNDSNPILVTVFGIVTDVNPLRLANAMSAMAETV